MVRAVELNDTLTVKSIPLENSLASSHVTIRLYITEDNVFKYAQFEDFTFEDTISLCTPYMCYCRTTAITLTSHF